MVFNITTNPEQLIEEHPWFSLAYFELYKKVNDKERERSKDILNRCAIFVHNRELLYRVSLDNVFINNVDLSAEEEPIQIITNTIPGGDYFSRVEMDAIALDLSAPIDKFIVEKPSLLRGLESTQEISETTELIELDESDFYTETLAKIYAEQGLIKRAQDVYAKLILLYPEKSSYFASLVKELTSKQNT